MSRSHDDMVRVGVVDEHALARAGICALLARRPRLRLAGVGSTPDDAGRMADLGVDLLVIDIDFAQVSGLQVLERVHEQAPNLRIVVVSSLDETLYAERCVRLGASAFVTKRGDAERLVHAVDATLRGDVSLSPGVMQRLATRLSDGSPADPFAALSRRELEVLQLMARGRSTRDIAGILHISPKTVETHRAKARRKLGAESAFDLLRIAIERMRT